MQVSPVRGGSVAGALASRPQPCTNILVHVLSGYRGGPQQVTEPGVRGGALSFGGGEKEHGGVR